MSIFINPGSGPVRNATRENAKTNMTQFAVDLTEGGYVKVGVSIPDQPEAPEDCGRFTFMIVADGEQHEIEMPGLPIEQVRWIDGPEQNIWDFPRLYVDGSSWVWHYALSSTMNDLEDES